MSILDITAQAYNTNETQVYSIQEFFDLVSKGKLDEALLGPHERLLEAIGKPERIKTIEDERLLNLYGNTILFEYKSFPNCYGQNEVIQKIVNHLKFATQGLEERKQILYLLGPVGGGKSSLADRLVELMEHQPFYAIKGSPVNDSPFSIVSLEQARQAGLTKKIPERMFSGFPSPWLVKRLVESNGDLSNLQVVKRYPSKILGVAISKIAPGDENTQDITSLVGESDISKLAKLSSSDTDSYLYSGGLCTGNRGLMEYVEMFKAPIKTLHPLLTACQEGMYKGSANGLGSIPFEALVIAHSNESEWVKFKSNKNNEAFIDRVNIIKVPYVLQTTEEAKIYNKLVCSSMMSVAPLAPHTLDTAAMYSVATRIKWDESDNIAVKLKVYNGESLKHEDKHALTLAEYKHKLTAEEGMAGASTREMYKLISKVFNYNENEVSANPVDMIYMLKKHVEDNYMNGTTERAYHDSIIATIETVLLERLDKDLKEAFLENHEGLAQNMFERYMYYADSWVDGNDLRDDNKVLSRRELGEKLSEMEKPAGIVSPKEFRADIVMATLKYQKNHKGEMPNWKDIHGIKAVIETRLQTYLEDFNDIIDNNDHLKSEEQKNTFEGLTSRMKELGYTALQTQKVCDYVGKNRIRKSVSE